MVLDNEKPGGIKHDIVVVMYVSQDVSGVWVPEGAQLSLGGASLSPLDEFVDLLGKAVHALCRHTAFAVDHAEVFGS